MRLDLSKSLTILAFIAFLPAGCAWQPEFARPQVVAEPNSVDVMIADAADRATLALETLAEIENAQSPVKPVAIVPNAPQELQRALTLEWTGPAEPLVADLARKAGYTYQAIGETPPVPLIVNVRATNQPLIEILRNIGLQMGSRADLKVNGETRMMEIHYANTVNRNTP